MMTLPVWLPGSMFLQGGLSVPGPMFHPWVSVWGSFCPGGRCVSVQGSLCKETSPRIREAGGTHPTGMLSRWLKWVRKFG